MGDYNVNTLIELKSSTTKMQDFSNIFSTFYYHKLINLPTRERKQSSTLLDNIYTNIPDCYDTGTSGIFTFLTQSDHYPIFTIIIVNKELELINIWLIANKLTVNIKKTHYMMFHRTRIKYNIRDITINGKNVAYTKNTKFLDVIIDNKLTWSDHSIYIKNKISKSIGIIHKTLNLKKNTLRNLYYTFVYPYLIYCVEIWGNTNDIHLDPLIKIQKSIRAITFSHHLDSTAPLFHNLNILNFKKLVTQRIALLMFKYHTGSLPVPISNLFFININRHNYYTRQINDLQLNTGRGQHVYKLFSFHGVRIWNHISKKIQTDVLYACFKNLSKTYLQNNEIPQRIR